MHPLSRAYGSMEGHKGAVIKCAKELYTAMRIKTYGIMSMFAANNYRLSDEKNKRLLRYAFIGSVIKLIMRRNI